MGNASAISGNVSGKASVVKNTDVEDNQDAIRLSDVIVIVKAPVDTKDTAKRAVAASEGTTAKSHLDAGIRPLDPKTIAAKNHEKYSLQLFGDVDADHMLTTELQRWLLCCEPPYPVSRRDPYKADGKNGDVTLASAKQAAAERGIAPRDLLAYFLDPTSKKLPKASL